MQINIDEYDMEHYCWQCKKTADQPRVVISVTLRGGDDVRGEVHLHRAMDLTCHGDPMIPDHRNRLVTRSFAIDDKSAHYETCAKIVMDYVRQGYEITYLKLI
jgi:hypothetical protein